MLRQIVKTVLLCTLLSTINADENPSIAKEMKLHKPFSMTIVNGSRLITLSSDWSHVFVNSTNEDTKVCEIPVDRNEHRIQKNVKATMLGDKIVVWGVRSRYIVNQHVRMDYTIMIVDPKQCTYVPVKTYEEEFLRFDINENLPEVVAHDDIFDVFYSSGRDCTPCRYTIDGKTVSLKQGIENEPLERSTTSHVKSFNSPDLKDGFFYAHNYNDQSSVIKLYDQNFNIIKQKKFEHKVDVAAVITGDKPSITICHAISIQYHPSHDEKVHCERFDANLESVFSTDLPLLEKHDPTAISLAVDEISGDSFVTVKESNDVKEIDVYRLYRLNSAGQVINTFKLREDARSKNLWSRSNLVLRGFIFDKQYCYETTKIWAIFINPSDADEQESVKCIAI